MKLLAFFSRKTWLSILVALSVSLVLAISSNAHQSQLYFISVSVATVAVTSFWLQVLSISPQPKLLRKLLAIWLRQNQNMQLILLGISFFLAYRFIAYRFILAGHIMAKALADIRAVKSFISRHNFIASFMQESKLQMSDRSPEPLNSSSPANASIMSNPRRDLHVSAQSVTPSNISVFTTVADNVHQRTPIVSKRLSFSTATLTPTPTTNTEGTFYFHLL